MHASDVGTVAVAVRRFVVEQLVPLQQNRRIGFLNVAERICRLVVVDVRVGPCPGIVTKPLSHLPLPLREKEMGGVRRRCHPSSPLLLHVLTKGRPRGRSGQTTNIRPSYLALT